MDNIMDKLLAEETFDCTKCKNLLRTPVMLVEDKGNMCYGCYKKCRDRSDIIALENTALVNILKKMKIPCEYKSQGCDEKLRYEDFYIHKDQCIHQTVRCNMSSNCGWTGSLNKLITHYEKDHKNRVLTSSDDCYKLFEIKDIRECFYVLKTSHGTFILNMMKCANRLQILIYDSNECGEIVQHSVFIKFVTDSGEKYKKMCPTTKNLKSFILVDDNSSAINMDLDHIREFLGEDSNVEVIIDLVDSSKNLEEMQEKLTCSKCRMYMKLNAYTCARGHNLCRLCVEQEGHCFFCLLAKKKDARQYTICDSCKNDPVCPLCANKVTKNAVLENFAKLTRFPCRFKNAGCMMKIAAISNHENTCDFRTWSCFVEGCSSHFCYPDLILHAVKYHKITHGFANLLNTSIHEYLFEERHFHVLEDNQVFHLVYEKQRGFNGIGVFTWRVNVLKRDDSQLYAFEVKIDFGLTHTFPTKGITLRGSCGSMRDINFGTKSTHAPVRLLGETLSSLYGREYETLPFEVRVFKILKLVS